MRIYLSVLLSCALSGLLAQGFNIDLISNVQYSTDAEYGNDIWGFVDKNSVEYAVVGSRRSTLLYELSDPSDPQLVYEVDGAVGVWRDMKSIGDYIYVTADQGNDGLLVIDMSAVGDSITHNFWRPVYDKGNGDEQLRRVHNIYADDRYVYLSGLDSDSRNGGILILDTEADPLEPPVAGVLSEHYSHDVFVQDTFLYASEIYIGELGVYSIADPANPVRLAGQQTTTDFTHNAWASADGRYAFTTDEVQDANVDAYDISDLDNIRFLDAFQPYRPDQSEATIPHNTHYHNGFLVTSWYEDGVIVIDGNKPDNLVEVASYDTHLQPQLTPSSRGFNGCWGVTPYLPSGLLLANDINTGLYVLEPNYVRASYLEGIVVDSITREPLPGATVEILGSRPHREVANDGTFKTGIGESGTFDVRVRAADYDTRIVTVNLESGIVNEQTFALLERAELTVILEDAIDQAPLRDGQILIVNDEFGEFVESQTGVLGAAVSQLDRGIAYDVYGTAWGYLSAKESDVTISNDDVLRLSLEAGIEDDFFTDMDWGIFGNAVSGRWTRGIPNGTTNGTTGETSNPDSDDDTDQLNYAYVTGNAGLGLGDDDVDDGFTVLTSPDMDALSADSDSMIISLSYWYYTCCGDAPLDDTLVMSLTNGIDEIELFRTASSTDGWENLRFALTEEDLSFTEEMRYSITASDLGAGHIVEAGLDAFSVTFKDTLSVDVLDITLDHLDVYPSPFSDQITITSVDAVSGTIQIYDASGRTISTSSISGTTTVINTASWMPGLYYVRVHTGHSISQTLSIVKQ